MASGVQKLVNKVKSGAREFADSLTPTLKVSPAPPGNLSGFNMCDCRNPSLKRVV